MANYEDKLDYEDEIGKRSSDAIIEYKSQGDMERFNQELIELKQIVNSRNETEEHKVSDNDVNILSELYNSFVIREIEDYFNISTAEKNQILENKDFSEARKVFLLRRISHLEWVKHAYEFEIGEPVKPTVSDIEPEVNRNPPPGSSESSGNYIDRCMENWINENFTNANAVDKIFTVIGGPANLAQAFISCEWTYYTN